MDSVQQQDEQKIYNPWNLANRRIPDAEILRIMRAYGIKERPQKWDLFRQACVHTSYIDRPEQQQTEPMIIAPRPEGCMPLCTADNEQIEFVGDSLLGCVIALGHRGQCAQRRRPILVSLA